MEPTPPRDDGDQDADALGDRSARAGERSAELAKLSDDALRRLRRAMPPDASSADREEPDIPPADWVPNEQMRRQHVVIVNADPVFLDAARVLLQGDRYNVTTTNLVPRTYEMVDAVGADAIVIDLTIGEPQIWPLLEQLGAGERTRSLPIVVTAHDPDLLARAERQPWRAGGRFLLLKPFDTNALVDAVHALVGPA